jgi:hypothetical protein
VTTTPRDWCRRAEEVLGIIATLEWGAGLCRRAEEVLGIIATLKWRAAGAVVFFSTGVTFHDRGLTDHGRVLVVQSG